MNFKKFSMHIIGFLAIIQLPMLGMMRRVAPKVLSVAPVVRTQARQLVSGQEKHPAWMQVNQDIEQFKKEHGLRGLLTQDQVKMINSKMLDAQLKQIKQSPEISFDAVQKIIKENVVAEIVRLLLKHGIDPNNVPITFVSSKMLQAWGQEGTVTMFVVGGGIFVNVDTSFQLSPDELVATIEHEIGHLISYDAAYLLLHAGLYQKSRPDWDYYKALHEKRADTHSGIQSEQNTKMLSRLNDKLPKGLGYDMEFKLQQIVRNIVVSAPIMLENQEMIALLSEPYHEKSIFEKIKNITMQEYKARKISAQALQEIVRLCDKSTYLEDLLDYHA